MSSKYHAEYPSDVAYDPAIRTFLEEFYAISDTADAFEQYADFYTEDATLTLGSKTANGRSEIMAMQREGCERVDQRFHKPLKVFPYGNASEAMLFDLVSYRVKATEQQSETNWTAYVHFAKDTSGNLKIDFYRVYVVGLQ